MRKTFQFQHASKKPERQVEAIKFEIKKYMARERRKDLPEDSHYWDFTCQLGKSADSLETIVSGEINNHIDQVFASGAKSLVIEVKAIAKKRQPKVKG